MPVPEKKRKMDESSDTPSKKSRHNQTFIQGYSTRYPALQKSLKGPTYARCTICNSDFSVAHGGINDCKTHVEGTRHKSNFESRKNQPSISQMFGKGPQEEEMRHKISAAEMLFMWFLIEHNVPVSAADHAGPLFRQMFPDSKIAQGFQCARTKTTALITHQAKKIAGMIAESAKKIFLISTDGSNDSNDKFFPIIITHEIAGKIKQSLLSVPTVLEASATGENIFKVMVKELERFGLKWATCISFGSDNHVWQQEGHVWIHLGAE
jgi:hypothetical protein